MTSPDTIQGHQFQDVFALAQAIQISAQDELEPENPIDLKTLGEMTTLYYSAWAQTLALGGEIQEGYDPRVIQAIQRFNYSLPSVSQGADPSVRNTILVSSFSEAVRQTVRDTMGQEIEPFSEESITAAVTLAAQTAFMLNRIEDYGLTGNDSEVYRVTGRISENVRLQRAQAEQLEQAEQQQLGAVELQDEVGAVPASGESEVVAGSLAGDAEDLGDEEAVGDGENVDDGEYVSDGEDVSASVVAAGNGDEGAVENAAVNAAPKGNELPEEPIILKDSNWPEDHLQHLRLLLSTQLVHVQIQEDGKVIFEGPYPAAYNKNPVLTRAILDRMGFDLAFFRDGDPRGNKVRVGSRLRTWLDEVDRDYRQPDRDGNGSASLRTRAKMVILNAVHPKDHPQTGVTFERNARKRTVDKLNIDINVRLRHPREVPAPSGSFPK